MRTQEQDTRSGLRIVTGVIATNGAIIVGTGFTCVKSGTGTYDITVPSFKAIRAAVMTLHINSGAYFSATGATGPNTVRFVTWWTNIAVSDTQFNFLIEGWVK